MSAVILAPAHAWFSESRPGLVVLSFPRQFSDADVQLAIRALEAFFRTTERPQAWIVDLSAIEGSTARQRAWFADYEKRVAEMTSRYVTRAAYIAPNQIVRGILTAIFWIQAPVYPHRVFSDRASGERWALSQAA
jgi:hypothetical protein